MVFILNCYECLVSVLNTCFKINVIFELVTRNIHREIDLSKFKFYFEECMVWKEFNCFKKLKFPYASTSMKLRINFLKKLTSAVVQGKRSNKNNCECFK